MPLRINGLVGEWEGVACEFEPLAETEAFLPLSEVAFHRQPMLIALKIQAGEQTVT